MLQRDLITGLDHRHAPLLSLPSSPQYPHHHPPPSHRPAAPGTAPISEEAILDVDDAIEDEVQVSWANTLVGYILPGKPYRKQAVLEALPLAWNTRYPVVVSALSDHKYLFRFQHRNDVKNVLEEGPWSVSGNLLVLEQWRDDEDWSFKLTEFWIQISNLPIDLLSLEFAFQLTTQLGNPTVA
ncbi:uncharacterized protein LOC122650876 [Telopea speciosissima]|uniref:uncharacterized protein LOC122650876 n=1 Tax=Telopea speciosissima TaxID=54955 RepID=UPI001CC7EA66|nr:uncharacterized protein LOC122650876 [Telopea speciosissima]